LTSVPSWLSAFPLRPATEAVDALCESWNVLASQRRPLFNPSSKEPQLTRILKAHVEYVTGRKRGLLGMWSTEAVINKVDFATGEIIEERRTDIVYGFNTEQVGIQIVFEFKKLDGKKRSRTYYLGEDGLLRFVTGIYGKNQPVAAMVGVLIDSFEKAVPPLREALSDKSTVTALKLRPCTSKKYYDQPSKLFSVADFDTEHDRPPDGQTPQSPIRVAHCFLSFAYNS